MLHGREMILHTMQSLRAGLSSDIRDTDHGPRLENLKSSLRTAYKLEREQGRRSHATNKRYYDKHAKHREYAIGDLVYLYNTAVKMGVSAKFRRPWVWPWRVTGRKNRLNYAIVDHRGKLLVVHVNRLKKAYAPVDWEGLDKQQLPRTKRPKRLPAEEQVGCETLSPGPIEFHGSLVGHPPAERRIPAEVVRVWAPRHQAFHPRKHLVTIELTLRMLHPAPLNHAERGETRDSPPLTRLRSRLLDLQEASEEEHVE
jgi:hypothetical protein